jgi:hypothetical protein
MPCRTSTRSQIKARHFCTLTRLNGRKLKGVGCGSTCVLDAPEECYIRGSIRSDSGQTESGNRAGDATVP